jgi:nitrate/nitrite transporter NarK
MDLTRFSANSILAIAMFSMLIQQAFSYLCQMVMPILADRLARDFGISPAWLGFFLALQNFTAIVATLGCGSFILRYGPLRISQMALVSMVCSLLLISSGQIWLYPLAAIFLGISGVSTAASSHILASVCPPRLASVVFSIKQTGVPVGSLIGGLLVPFLLGLVFYSATLGTTIRLGTYGAAFTTGLVVIVVAAALQPIRAHFDVDRDPDQKISLGDMRHTLTMVVANPLLRDVAFGAFAFGGLQSIFAGFFILYLIDNLGYSEVEAGSAFAICAFSAIWARILWGALGGSVLSPRHILAAIGFFGGVAALSMTLFDLSWSLNGIIAVGILYNITALSWHGVIFAETASLAPKGQVGSVTGGVLAFIAIAMMIYPAIFGFILAATESYKTGFALASAPAFIACIVFLNSSIPESWLSFVTGLGRRLTSARMMTQISMAVALGVAFAVMIQGAYF